ncbi:MAG: aldo/keto reductase, partial [Lentisphaeria bacterium]|nr:aldo/keto reductase [Lentisphaeria bacterium]NQZ70820.1 aldo/keto reductase [Lentisphaeria bacterium]
HRIDGFVASQPKWNLLKQDDMSEAERQEPAVLLYLNGQDRDWHTDSQVPVIPYAPAANGFFAMEGKKPEHKITEENTARAGRVSQLASELGASPGQVALAWLQAQPFPVIPILGTSDIEHLKDAMGAVDVDLSKSQADWLETGE